VSELRTVISAIALGLVWRDFAGVWQPIENLGAVPHRETLACVFAVGLLSAGAASMWRRTAQID
jgi:hypothetical protein